MVAAGFLAVPVEGQPAGSDAGAGPGAQSMFEALRRGEIAIVRTAIAGVADVNSCDAHGNTLLMQAAVYGTAADMEFLLTHGADVKAGNYNGYTALMRAMPDLAKVRVLVDHGADVNAVAQRATPLLIAAGIPASEDVIHYLLDKGADLRPVNELGFDAVSVAAAAGAAGNLRVLLDAGANATRGAKGRRIVDRPGTIFDEAANERIRKRAEGVTPLMNAARAGCEPCVRLLLEHGADAAARTDAGLTALHHAAFKGAVTMVKLLLDSGASANVADDRGFTPLMMAANSRSKDPQVVRLLLERGADTQPKDNLDRTAADWAQIGGRSEITAMFSRPTGGEVVKPLGDPAFPNIHAAVAKSITLLEDTAPKFLPKTGCISCHHVSIPLMALTEARRSGYPVKQGTTQLLVKQTVASFTPERERVFSGIGALAGRAPTGTYGLVSLYGEGYAPDALTDAIARCLAIHQGADGSWFSGLDTRPPLSAESTIPDTAMSARALRLYAPPGMAREVEMRIARARTYLLAATPRPGDDYPYRLLGLLWTGATEAQIRAAAGELAAQQQPNGGWAQNGYMPSDAYETGLSLWALASTNTAAVDTLAYRRGVDYLMRTQEKDGSWHVRSRAFGFQPYFESGFPHGHDQWISMAATAWSAMALMPAAVRERTEAAR
jgi:ankyrin repeat protein